MNKKKIFFQEFSTFFNILSVTLREYLFGPSMVISLKNRGGRGPNWPKFGFRFFLYFISYALISVIKTTIFLNLNLGLDFHPPLPENRSSGSTSLLSYHIILYTKKSTRKR